MNVKSHQDGFNIETRHPTIDQTKYQTYRKLRIEFDEKIATLFKVDGWEAVIAAASEFREALAETLSDGNPTEKAK
jgi:hypothetical protein